MITKKAVVAPKKTTKKTTVAARRPLTYASPTQAFWLTDGGILDSLVALRDALSGMKKTVYDHHVGKDKNDFADWVAIVLGDRACADDLRKAKTAAGAKTVVVRYLKSYTL
jgi:nanoRNase/pAp phosphatase (c-di-AMP/oligoRNAs hydrolase)